MRIAAAMLTIAAPAAAQELKAPPPRLDPAKAYVFARIGPTSDRNRRAARAHFWRYDVGRSQLRGLAGDKLADGQTRSFTLGDKALGHAPPLDVGGFEGYFLAAVTPGTYVLHGTDSTALALGSVAFAVEAGRITDIGTLHIAPEDGSSGYRELRGARSSADLLAARDVLVDAVAHQPAGMSSPPPSWLRAFAVEAAAPIVDVRFLNVGSVRGRFPGGLLVNRLTGLPPVRNGDGAALVAKASSPN